MYKVVLIDKESSDVLGDIGEYSSLRQAEHEVMDYNRKGDRHRGHAVVQAQLSGTLPERTERTERNNNLRLRQPSVERHPQSIHQHRQNLQQLHGVSEERRIRPQNRQNFPSNHNVHPMHPHSHTHYEEPSSEEEISSEETETFDEVMRRENREPSWRERSTPQTKQKLFALLIDDYHKKAIVLEHNQFLNNFMLANPQYQLKSTGEIHNMINERNQYLRNR